MTLIDTIEADSKDALRAKDVERLSVLRLIKTAVKNTEISKGSSLTEQEIVSVVEKQAKQRRDSIVQFEKGNRPDLAEKEKSELNIIENYLPQKLSLEDLNILVDSVISEVKPSGITDMGKVIKEVMTKAGGSADGGTVSRIVKEKLQ